MWLDNQQDIADKFIFDYTSRFNASRIINRDLSGVKVASTVSYSNNMMLTKIPDINEVKDALFSIDGSKTPGPDGFGAGFFKHYWNLIKSDFYQCITEFFINGKLIRQISHTFLTLIPKRDNPSETQHYRPISLCNTVYKTISKILANRLRSLLDKLISPLQSAFIRGLSIHDNIPLTHEIMHKFKKVKGKTAWVALKLDMEKTNYRLEWDYIKKCLHLCGFHSTWIKWVTECITQYHAPF